MDFAKRDLNIKKKWNVDQFLSTETRGCHFYLLIPVFGWTLFAIISDRHFYLRCGKITFFFCVRFYKKCSLDCKKHSILLFLRILRHCKHVRDLIFGFQLCRFSKNDPALNFVYLQAWIFGHVFFLTCCLLIFIRDVLQYSATTPSDTAEIMFHNSFYLLFRAKKQVQCCIVWPLEFFITLV